MLTKPVNFNLATQLPVSLTGRCKIFVQGTEQDVAIAAAIYLIVKLVRMRLPHEVFYEDGRLLLRHSGYQTLESDPNFEEAVVAFSEFFLEEQRVGYALYEAAVKADQERADEAQSSG